MLDLKAIFSSFYPNKSANTEKDFTSSTTYFLIFLLSKGILLILSTILSVRVYDRMEVYSSKELEEL